MDTCLDCRLIEIADNLHRCKMYDELLKDLEKCEDFTPAGDCNDSENHLP